MLYNCLLPSTPTRTVQSFHKDECALCIVGGICSLTPWLQYTFEIRQPIAGEEAERILASRGVRFDKGCEVTAYILMTSGFYLAE